MKWLVLFGAVLRVLSDDADFVAVPADGEDCITPGRYFMVGAALQNSPHTAVMSIDFETYDGVSGRFVLLNIGQLSPGAHHWIQHPDTLQTEFGAWNGDQLALYYPLTSCASVATIYDGDNYTLYCDTLMLGHRHVRGFGIGTQEIRLGTYDDDLSIGDFPGCIKGFKLYYEALTEEELFAVIATDITPAPNATRTISQLRLGG